MKKGFELKKRKNKKGEYYDLYYNGKSIAYVEENEAKTLVAKNDLGFNLKNIAHVKLEDFPDNMLFNGFASPYYYEFQWQDILKQNNKITISFDLWRDEDQVYAIMFFDCLTKLLNDKPALFKSFKIKNKFKLIYQLDYTVTFDNKQTIEIYYQQALKELKKIYQHMIKQIILELQKRIK